MDILSYILGKKAGGGGGEAVLINKSVTANGTYNASSDSADGYKKVEVAVPNSYGASDEGKVVSNGALVAQGSDTVTENDTYDTTLISELTVNIQAVDSRVDAILNRSISGMFSSETLTAVGKDAFRYCDALTGVCLPNLTTVYDEGLKENGVVIADLGSCSYLYTMALQGSQTYDQQVLRTVILRKTNGVCQITGQYCFFRQHNVTVYVPSALISTYQSATNWSGYVNDGTVTFAAIEGSIYETQYADGTPIS